MRTANSAAQRRKNGFLCNSITIGEPHDQGLVFKWGSLVGIEMLTVAGNGTLPFVAGNVEFTPAGFTGTITDDWTTVPWCNTDFGDYDTTATDHLSRVNDPNTGIGDICRHMGEVDGSQWRMPTAKDWEDLYGSDQINGGKARQIDNNSDWSPGLFAPLHGYAFGQHQSIVTIVSDAEVANANPYINGAVFLPASGYRHPDYNGTVYWIGSWGHCWSSTAQSAGNVYHMQFDSLNVYPQQSVVRTYAWSIRCIRE